MKNRPELHQMLHKSWCMTGPEKQNEEFSVADVTPVTGAPHGVVQQIILDLDPSRRSRFLNDPTSGSC